MTMTKPATTTADPGLRKSGLRLLAALHAGMQALKLYPLENETVQRTLEELHGLVTQLIAQEGRLELHRNNGCFFLNQVRLPLEVSTYMICDAMERALSRFEIGSVDIGTQVQRSEWPAFLATLLTPAAASNSFATVQSRLARAAVANIRVHRETSGLRNEERTETARRVYVRSVRVANEVLTGIRMGQAVNMRRVKRSVQGIVDQVLTNQVALVGMTTLRNFDEYTFTHSVNVCILSVIFGQKLGLDRHQLYELGLCGLFHDLGKMRIDPKILHKPGSLTAPEWAEMRQHPSRGLLALFQIRGFGDLPLRQMLVAYEHHMKTDLSGYPRVRRPRQPTLFTRLVSITDTFDAVTSERSYRARAWTPDTVLYNMRDQPSWGLDRVLVKAFINVTGIYPVGTLVVLTDKRVAVVAAHNPERPLAPLVKVIADAAGHPYSTPETLDLAEGSAEAGTEVKILKTVDGKRYHIDVGRYFE
jgi:HD-GYP domain-containing protein (c-di-GMP phosphodiesterase class II)